MDTGNDTVRGDEELAALDLPVLIREGLTDRQRHGRLFGEGAVGAAVLLDRARVRPRSVTYLATVVRAGGLRYAAQLAEPLPEPEAGALAAGWLGAAAEAEGAGAPECAERFARWLEAVATVIAVRLVNRGEPGPTD